MNPRMLLAVVIVVVAALLVATSGDSYAVRYLTGLVSVDVAVRLASAPSGARRVRA